jgi:hypothetical protein
VKLKTPHCPECGALAAGTHERGIEACATLRIEDDGLADWEGTTDYWEGSATVTDARGRIELVCPTFHSWFSEDEHSQQVLPPPQPKIVITVEGGVVQAVNVSPELGPVEVVVKDYDVDGPNEPGLCVDANGDRCYLLDCQIGQDVALPRPLDVAAALLPKEAHAPCE